MSMILRNLSVVLLGLVSVIGITGCNNSYNAVEEVGYDSPWYVTVVHSDGTRGSVRVEELAEHATQEMTPQPIEVEGFDRRTQEAVLIDIQKAVTPVPHSTFTVNRYKTHFDRKADSEKQAKE